MIRSFSQHVNSFCLEKFDNSIFSVLSNHKTLDTTSFHQNKFSDFLTIIHKVFLQSNLLFFKSLLLQPSQYSLMNRICIIYFSYGQSFKYIKKN